MTVPQTYDAGFPEKGRDRGLVNLSGMGHCTAAVIQTLLDQSDTRAAWLVRLAAGLPDGIGNNGRECGGITAPLIMLGLRHAVDTARKGVPVIVYKGHDLLRRFKSSFRSPLCEEIRSHDRLPLTCINVIRRVPEFYKEALSSGCEDAISQEQIETYGLLRAYFAGRGFRRGFHCSHDVLHRLRGIIPVDKQLLDAAAAFVGGTVYSGMSCSALIAGLMAMGLALCEIENGRAHDFAHDLNMNSGHRLGEWFRSKFGSTLCSDITQSDFSKADDVERFIAEDGASVCNAIAQDVAQEARDMIESSLERKAG